MLEADEERVRRVEKTIAQQGLRAEIIWHRGRPVLSLQDAVSVLGINPRNVLKCLLLRDYKGKTVALIAPGDIRVDVKKVERLTGVKKPRFLTREELHDRFGTEPGGIDPLTFTQGVDVVLMEASLLQRQYVIGSAGSKYCGLKIIPQEILKVVSATVADLAET